MRSAAIAGPREPGDIPIGRPGERYRPRVLSQPPARLELSREQAGSLSHPIRAAIAMLLQSRPETTDQLARRLRRPRGTVGYHLKQMHRLGLVQVVATHPVRAMTEKFYGLTAREFRRPDSPSGQTTLLTDLATIASDLGSLAGARAVLPLRVGRARLGPGHGSFTELRVRDLLSGDIPADMDLTEQGGCEVVLLFGAYRVGG